jgi:ribosomal protein L11 methyltransferase
MSNSSRRLPLAWSWQRRIEAGREDDWIEKLRLLGCVSWAFTARPGRTRVLLTAYLKTRAEALGLTRHLGGQVRQLRAGDWLSPRPSPPLQIGSSLRVIHEKPKRRDAPGCPQLLIPLGIAFGGGEHATTSMLLRALMRHPGLTQSAVLDLGTGSGILALAARLRGARRIVATDWDADAVRTARQNEALNFPRPLISWRKADVKRLKSKARFDLVLGNLFSGILCEAAAPIASALSPAGQLWLSGILRHQEAEVVAAYKAQKLRLVRSLRRGKWVMLILER